MATEIAVLVGGRIPPHANIMRGIHSFQVYRTRVVDLLKDDSDAALSYERPPRSLEREPLTIWVSRPFLRWLGWDKSCVLPFIDIGHRAQASLKVSKVLFHACLTLSTSPPMY